MQRLLQGGSSIRSHHNGAASIGLIVITFVFAIFIVIPLFQFAFEMQYINVYKERVKVASELAVYDLMLQMDAHALSEKKILWNEELEQKYKKAVEDKMEGLGIAHPINDIGLSFDNQLNKRSLKVHFTIDYSPLFLEKLLKDKKLNVDFSYYFPIND